MPWEGGRGRRGGERGREGRGGEGRGGEGRDDGYTYCNRYVHYQSNRPLSRRLDRCDRVIQNESRDPFGGSVYYVTMQITFLTRKFRNGERN